MSMTKISRFLCVGPGGKKCNCCFPAPGKRKEIFRSAKRRSEREAKKIIKEQIE